MILRSSWLLNNGTVIVGSLIGEVTFYTANQAPVNYYITE